MKRSLCGVCVAAALAGCLAPETPGKPIVLSYPADADGARAFAGYRHTAEAVAAAYVRVVIYVTMPDRGPASEGVVSGASGLIADPRGYVVTPAHVARRAGYRARLTTIDGRVRSGRVVHVDPGRDLALIALEPFPGMHVASLTRTDAPRPGEPVFTIGSPGNHAGVVSIGRIAEPWRAEPIDYGDFGHKQTMVLDMEIEPGDSGGPVFDLRGRLIGMITGFALGDTRRVPYVSTGIAYALPSAAIADYLREALALLPAKLAYRTLNKN